MSYELSYKHEPNYLHVQVTGIRTIENIIAMLKDYHAVSDKHGYSKVVLDVRGMTGKLGVFNAYKLGKKNVQEFSQPGQLKVSIIDLEENRELSEFMENVVVNAGFNVRIFSDVDEAMEWLGVANS